MIRYLYIVILLFSSSIVFSQVDRTIVPKPSQEPSFTIGEFHEFTMDNGLKVIVVENSRIPRITYQLRIDRQPLFEAEKAGYSYIAGQLLSAGTKSRTKAQLNEEVDFYGARLFTGSTLVYCTGLSRHKNELMDILADVTLNPVFPQDELDKLKSQILGSLQTDKEDPSSISSNITSAVVYGKNHPYGEIETEETISAISLEDVKDYYNQFFTPKAGYLVIYGDITLADAKKMANAKFGKWDGHKLVKGIIDVPELPASNQVSFGHKTGAVQSVLKVTYPIVNKPGSEDEVAASIMNAILGGASFGARLMQNLREDKAYTYGCRSSLGNGEYVSSFSAGASVRNEVTDSALAEILNEMQGLIDAKATESELSRVKASLKGAFSRGLESPQTIAGYALNIALYDLPKDYYNTYLQRVEAVTLDDVKAAAAKFLKPQNAHIVVVGDGVNVAPKLEKFGKVSFYDAYGFPTTAPGFTLNEGTTAIGIIENAIKAYGGKVRLEKAYTYELVKEANGPMGSLEISKSVSTKKKMYLQVVSAGGNLISETKVYKGNYSEMSMGQTKEVDENAKNSIDRNMPLFEEMWLLNETSNLKLVGGEFLNGEKVAVLEYTKDGESQKRFYSLETGYLVSTSQTIQGRELTWSYSDYKSFDGIMYPSKSSNSALPMPFEVKSLNVNVKLSKSLFK